MAPSVGLPESLVDDVGTPDAARAAGRQSAPRSATAASLFYPVRLVLWLLRWMCCQVLVASGLRVCCCVCHLTAAESTGAMAAARAEPDDNLLLRQKQHDQKAFGFISKALRYDDEKHALKELAIVLYSKGIEELQKVIVIDFSQEKESMVKIEHMGDDPPWHADVPRPPQVGQRLRAWQKTLPGQDAASANRDDSSWLKTAQNGRVAADGQSHDRATSGDLKELAIDLYCKGIEDLENGIAIDFSQGKGSTLERARRLADKMRTNLQMARDRLDFLVTIKGQTPACWRGTMAMHGVLVRARTLPSKLPTDRRATAKSSIAGKRAASNYQRSSNAAANGSKAPLGCASTNC